jgi:hypothetical protein
MTMSLQLQLDNSPQNLQLQLDNSTRIFQLHLEILTFVAPQSHTVVDPNQTKQNHSQTNKNPN